MATTLGKSANEGIKDASDYLRGTILDGLANAATGSLSKDDQQLTKFHGIYQQDDRDIRKERRQKKLEPAYSFMIRVRVPGGVSTPVQWLEMDRIALEHANGALKLTTRQAFQFHGVIKSNLKKTIAEINQSLFDTLAACGDVNRNVMCNPNPHQSKVHADVLELATEISNHLSPRTSAYHEIWLDDGTGEKVKVTYDPPKIDDIADPEEPIYGKHYLPRKFKTVVAVPPSNDVDIFAHDLGFIAIIENDKIVGYNVTVGGGMGMTHGNEETFPRLADVMGFCTPEQAVTVAEAVVRVQRDHGNRDVRANARLKYTIETMGLDAFRAEVEKLIGYELGAVRPYHFEDNGDRFGWIEDHTGNWHFTLFVENGRVYDTPAYQLLTGLREIAKVHTGDLRLTANQNLIIANITPQKKAAITELLEQYKMIDAHERSALRLNSMACVALPTCGLALAESQRYLPDLITELDSILEGAGLRHDAITIRMTGCPNGCARPYIAEIGFVGKAPGKYNLYLGGGHAGQRLNKLYASSIEGSDAAEMLKPLIQDYAKNREEGERFGDFTVRAGYVKATEHGRDFHKELNLAV
ncbi:MAG: NADPH-dependent assimilatory sulfite reductase hemoprotein subunit [Verrucomicrobiales bacterium]|jgi:sulfite reductase (NADPH) hemoprotein beta-component|nr:NADPH-dependent assimilatory sulfite reductase hemoprotein subunit [Verrucomicrobiales bacterium]MDP4791019.1 NADPH-dependent assimilatory sulfite reductase hemoprotein subunit [Verrucomicrobiales bacterium]MDP5007306.1 NADPH-dependent assimilatory sulfite reductase hemoprotein subunit [Verrucomicrobiales bacterium]